MTSIQYDEIYSRFFTKVEAYDLIDEDMMDTSGEFMCNWLRSSVYEPYIRRLFKAVSMDDDEEVMGFEMRYEIDEGTDLEFVINLLSWGMVYNWVAPKVYSITNIVQHFTSSDQKYYSQASHLSQLQAIKSEAEAKMRALVRDRGYLYNSYLDRNTPLRNS